VKRNGKIEIVLVVVLLVVLRPLVKEDDKKRYWRSKIDDKDCDNDSAVVLVVLVPLLEEDDSRQQRIAFLLEEGIYQRQRPKGVVIVTGPTYPLVVESSHHNVRNHLWTMTNMNLSKNGSMVKKFPNFHPTKKN
jgi:hypothetical protein